MLAKISMRNFKSFRNLTTVDLRKTNYTMLPSNVDKSGVVKGGIFIGANASGKSNIILAVKLLLDFLFLERTMNSGVFICIFGKKTSYMLEYEFEINGETIRYSFEFDTAKSSLSEHLYVEDRLLMERMGTYAKSYIADEDGITYDSMDVGEDTLFLRTLYFNTKFTSNRTLAEWMEFLQNSIYVNMFNNEIIPYRRNQNVNVSKYLAESGCDEINEFFDEYNFEQNIEYDHSSRGGAVTFTVGADENQKSIFFKRKDIEIPIPFIEESMGNQNLLRVLPSFLCVIKNGGMLLIDEFSSGFHNDLESLLVRYFMEKSVNAQMIFVSHSTNLLNNSLLRPDQEYAVEFNSTEGSSVKRFSSEQPRAAQNIEKMYNSGVFGGLPRYSEE